MRKLRLRGAYLIIANNPVVQGRSETEVGLLVSEAGARGSKPISAAALSVLNFNSWEFKFPFTFRTPNLELMFKQVHTQISKHMEYMSICAY